MNLIGLLTRSNINAFTKFRAFVLLVSLTLLVAPVIFLVEVLVNSKAQESNYAVIRNSTRGQPAEIHSQQNECSESADLRVLLFRDLNTIAFPRIPTTVSGTRSAIVRTLCPTGRQETRISLFAWKLETPPGSTSTLSNTNTLTVTFTPDRVGTYVVKLTACPNTCKLRLLTGHTSTGKPIHEDQEIGPVERVMNIEVPAVAQLPPLYNPPNLPSPSPAATPENYAEPRSHCGGTIGIGIGNSPQWFTTKTWTTPTPPYDLAEGRVYHTLVSRKDHPASHNSNDANMLVELDPPFRRLLVNDTPEDKGALLPFGGLEIEWERDDLPEPFRAV